MLWLTFRGPDRCKWKAFFGNIYEYPELWNRRQQAAPELYDCDQFAALTCFETHTIWVNNDRGICPNPKQALLHELSHVSAHNARDRDFSAASEEKVVRAIEAPLFQLLTKWGLKFPDLPRRTASTG